MQWTSLNALNQIEQIKDTSTSKYILVFKHSTTCSISLIAKLKLEEEWKEDIGVETFYLDLKQYQDVSGKISNDFEVHHESPQVLLIRDRQCIYDASHFDISVQEILEAIEYHEAQ
ncbi:MAG: bacillithiol system redox-active protein YtxJ [Saprospiraceae bacterium]